MLKTSKFAKLYSHQTFLLYSSYFINFVSCVLVVRCDVLQGQTQNVAVKSFFGGNSGDEDIDLIQIYADMRLELNKLVALNHSNIVKCIGFCVSLLSFVLEWAPFGSTRNIMESYSRSGCHLCPEALVHTIKQVKIYV